MTATKKILFQLALAPLFICNVVAQEMELRVLPSGPCNLRWSFTNASSQAVSIPSYFFSDDNNLLVAFPERSASGWENDGCLGPVGDYAVPPEEVQIFPNGCRIEFVSKKSFSDLVVQLDPDKCLRCRWWMRDKFTPHIILACATVCGRLQLPCIGTATTNAAAYIAFVFNELEPNDLAFLCLNGSNSTNNIASPIGSGSSLIVTSPSIVYSNEVTSTAYASTNALVAPKTAMHWRIPWSDVWGLIPVEDRKKLEKAGKIDLRWKCGDIVSDPLPLWVGTADAAPTGRQGYPYPAKVPSFTPAIVSESSCIKSNDIGKGVNYVFRPLEYADAIIDLWMHSCESRMEAMERFRNKITGSSGPLPLPSDREYGFDIGDCCYFGHPHGSFKSVFFIRNNVVVSMRSSVDIVYYAKRLDQQILSMSTNALSQVVPEGDAMGRRENDGP